MKLKTKQILAGLGMGITAVVGLSCVGLGLYAILTMKRPYINQWVDLAKENFDPIVSQIDSDFVKQETGQEVLTEGIVKNFYIEKAIKTPEVFVEDLLAEKNKKVHPFDSNPYLNFKIRISDPTITKDDANNYYISFLFNESFKANENAEIYGELEWSGSYTNVPLSVNLKSNVNWNISVKPVENKGDATIKVIKNTSSITQEVGTYTIVNGQIQEGKTLDEYFYDFTSPSRYLYKVNIG